MLPVTVLLVDDFEPFRRLTRSILEELSGVPIVGEASDGLEAIQKADELRPDLILLDVGLPKLSGIHAARKILRILPSIKIVFLSQETSDDVVEEAFRLGAFGYVAKVHATTDLPKLIEQVRQSKRLFSLVQFDEDIPAPQVRIAEKP